MPVLRSVKNVVNNYTEAEIKVREATSNDPWGPSSSLMSQIAELTHNQIAFTEVMAMLWKRLNDHGKNWRHVYKALLVIDYLVKNGSERVTHQCKENIFAIETLKNFQFIDQKGKDEGVSVRERSQKLADLLRNEEFLKTEREKARTARSRMSQQMPVSSLEYSDYGARTQKDKVSSWLETSSTTRGFSSSTRQATSGNTEMEAARPQTTNEEDLQLQLALEMSKAEQDNVSTRVSKEKAKEDLRLEMAIKESLKEEQQSSREQVSSSSSKPQQQQADLLGGLGDPWSAGTAAAPPASSTNNQSADLFAMAPNTQAPTTTASNAADPWGLGMPTVTTAPVVQNTPPPVVAAAADPWGSTSQAVPQQTQQNDPWGASTSTTHQAPPPSDPWGQSQQQQPTTTNSNDLFTTNNQFSNNNNGVAVDPFNMNSMTHEVTNLGEQNTTSQVPDQSLSSKFLGNFGADLVNLDSLSFNVSPSVQQSMQQNNNNKSNISPSPYMVNTTLTPANTAAMHPHQTTTTAAPVTTAPVPANTINGLDSMSNNPFGNVQQSTGNVFNNKAGMSNNPFAPQTFGPTLNQLRAETTQPNSFQSPNDLLQPQVLQANAVSTSTPSSNVQSTSINPFM